MITTTNNTKVRFTRDMSSHNQASGFIRVDDSCDPHNVGATAVTLPPTTAVTTKPQQQSSSKASAATSAPATAIPDYNQRQIIIDDNKASLGRHNSTTTLEFFDVNNGEQSRPNFPEATIVSGHTPTSGKFTSDGYQLKPSENNHFIDITNSSQLDANSTGSSSSRKIKFKSLLAPAVIDESDELTTPASSIKRHSSKNEQEFIDLTSFNGPSSSTTYCDTGVDSSGRIVSSSSGGGGKTSNNKSTTKQKISTTNSARRQVYLNETILEQEEPKVTHDNSDDTDDADYEHDNFFDDDYDADNLDSDEEEEIKNELNHANNISISPSHHRFKSRNTFFNRVYQRLKYLGSDLTSKITNPGSSSSTISYTAYEDTQATGSTSGGARKYRRLKKHKNPEQNFRGSYRYSRIGIVMTIIRKLLSFMVQRSTLALIGAFLIHVTLGTIYTLSNINSYLTSYMRKHGSPNATYGGSMWISSSYAVGQGISMVLGGLIERRFSARVSCILGCALHSLSIMSTSKSIDYGQLAVLLTYGFLPGFGCGLAYMTPMSNGFGWFPHRKGLVAGVILAGFGIGTFVFNMAQTAYVNPYNLSPPKDANNYFTQDDILNNVPHLFIFLGTIYASMQFIGCCLLFKPPASFDPSSGRISSPSSSAIMSDERPILMADSEMSFKKAIQSREFIVLFLVFGITNQGVLFVNSMLKEYGQIFIKDDLYLAWTGSMASIANSLGRLVWGMAIDRYSFTQCFTSITTIFGTLIFLMPFEFVLSSKLLYLLCTLGIFGSFSGWMSTYPVHLSRIFGLANSGMIYGLIFVSQSLGGILTAFAAHYLIDQYTRFVPFFCVTLLEVLGLTIYHLFYQNK